MIPLLDEEERLTEIPPPALNVVIFFQGVPFEYSSNRVLLFERLGVLGRIQILSSFVEMDSQLVLSFVDFD